MGRRKLDFASKRPLGLLLTAALLPVVLVAAALGATSVHEQRAAMEREALDRAEALATLLDQQLRSDLNAIDLLAQTPALDGATPDLDRFRLISRRTLSRQRLWRALSVSTPDGMRIIDEPEPIGGRLGPVIEPQSHGRAVATREPVFGDIRSGPSRRTAFAIRAPVVRRGEVRYVVSAVVEPDAIRSLLLLRNLPEGWEATITDGSGSVVASTDPALRSGGRGLGPVAPGEAGRLRDVRSPSGADLVAVDHRLANAGWSVQVALPRSLYREPLDRLIQILIAGGILTLLLAGTFMWLFLRDARRREAAEAALAQGQRLEALGKMTGGVAHDFNNLLTPIVGALDMVRTRIGDPRLVGLVEGALTSAERARTLITRLLGFARRQHLEARDISLRRLLIGMRDLIERSIGPSVQLVLELPDEALSVRADPNQLELALLNLAVNARDAMPEGGTLTIDAGKETVEPGAKSGLAPGDYGRIRVSDTGHGMDAATARRAIEPFYSTKEPGRGTGLGLSMVHGLAAQSGGDLAIDSAPGQGTRVTMRLPAADYAPVAETADPPLPEILSPLRILLVDDEDLVRTATAAMLAEAGHEVDQAHSGGSALKIFEAAPGYDLVVTDYAMPLMSGAALIRRVRAISPDIGVLLITGYASAAIDVPDDVPRIEKPFRAAELLGRIEALNGDKASGGEAH